MRLLIVEDELLVADYLRQLLTGANHQVIGIAEDVDTALQLINEKPELVFVDINLANEQSGLDLGLHLKAKQIPFIYLTANNEMATIKKAAITAPSGYLTKPYNKSDILASLELVRNQLKTKEQRKMRVRTSKGEEYVNLEDVLFVKADGVYVEIHLANRVILQRMTLKDFQDNVKDDVFVKVHRSYVVNINHITLKKSQSIEVGSIEIPVSRSYAANLMD